MSKRVSFWQANSLSLVVSGIFVVCLAGQFLAGYRAWNEELREHGQPPLTVGHYVSSGHFLGATFENWESEFLQMGMYVLLTVRLRQRGSAESRPLPGEADEERVDAGPRPWPVRAGGWWRTFYGVSLSTALLSLFALSWLGHAWGSWQHAIEEQRLKALPPPGFWEHVAGAQFWFESLQNWQSEFLAVLALVLLSIVLRQDKSPESKPLEAPHAQTGG